MAACKLTSIESNELIQKLLNQGILELICFSLKHRETKYIAVSLDGLRNLLEYGKLSPVNGINLIALKLEKIGTVDYLEGLQRHHVEDIYEKTIKIIENYFALQENQF